MPRINQEDLDLILVEDKVWVIVGKVDLPSYDFSLADFFAFRRPWHRPEKVTVSLVLESHQTTTSYTNN